MCISGKTDTQVGHNGSSSKALPETFLCFNSFEFWGAYAYVEMRLGKNLLLKRCCKNGAFDFKFTLF